MGASRGIGNCQFSLLGPASVATNRSGWMHQMSEYIRSSGYGPDGS